MPEHEKSAEDAHAGDSVSDVRRVRERLSREANHDVRKLAEKAEKVAGQMADSLGLKIASLPVRSK